MSEIFEEKEFGSTDGKGSFILLPWLCKPLTATANVAK